MRACTSTQILATTLLWVSLASCGGRKPVEGNPVSGQPPAQTLCNGTFSDGTAVSATSPQWLEDVPGDQTFCDFHTFAWNQYLWLIQDQGGQPRFLGMAPWYNLFVQSGSTPGPYPGGDTSLQLHQLDKAQAGDSFELVDVPGQTVLYDIRFNQAMYDDVQARTLYSQAGYGKACNPGAKHVCQQEIWLPPNDTSADGSLELKTAWRQFADGACPSTMYCVEDVGLVGMHLVQKTKTHGEWIWASFEHVANAPDCAPNQSNPIAAAAPTGEPWGFFDPQTVPAGVMSTQTCDVTVSPPQCNGDPRVQSSCGGKGQPACTYKAVNICRTDALPAGGASSDNCKVVNGQPNEQSNNGGNVACLNATFEPQASGPWQNYQLIGTLWLRGTTGPTEDFRIQVFQTQDPNLPYEEPVGFVHLSNTTMETWLQDGSTGFDVFKSNATQAGCFLCHQLPSTGGSFPTADLSHSVSKIQTGSSTKLFPVAR